MSGRQNDKWGVHLETTKAVLFKGTVYSALGSDNVVLDLPNSVTISSILLNGGGAEVIFQDKLGSTATDGNITMIDTVSGVSKVISVAPIGMTQIQ